ncbi:MAG: response regulator [Alphaproteobacteria bacterium]|nr:MAG: response regulator [Alphaproteobacteria bacterium]
MIPSFRENVPKMYPVEQEILVVEGDETARALIEQTLVEQGFAVVAVADGNAALRQIEARPFAVVIAEIGLPGTLDGLTTVHRARALQPRLKCLFTSRFAPSPPWCIDELDEFIAKPFHPRELLGCVFELIERDGAPQSTAAEHLGYCYV